MAGKIIKDEMLNYPKGSSKGVLWTFGTKDKLLIEAPHPLSQGEGNEG